MSKKLSISFKDGSPDLLSALGISEDRGNDLTHRINLISHEALKPFREDRGEHGMSSLEVIKLCIALAENENELILCAYGAGTLVATIFHTEEEGDFMLK